MFIHNIFLGGFAMDTTELKVNFESFQQNVSEYSIGEQSVIQKTMDLLLLVIYSPVTKIGEVDFNAFTITEGERAFEELHHYHPDDVCDELEDEDENKDNLLVEINRVCHMGNIASSMKTHGRKRRFF